MGKKKGTRRLRSPIPWLGGKSRMVSKIAPLLPQCGIYVEPFGGAASMLLAREPSSVEVYNDVDGRLVNFFRVVRDPAKARELRRMLKLTPFSRGEFHASVDLQAGEGVKAAHAFFIRAKQSFAGETSTWGFAKTSTRGMSQRTSAWLGGIELLPLLTDRIMRVQIEQVGWEACMKNFDTPETLFYCDPPYFPGARKNGQYKHELTEDDHERFLCVVRELKGAVAISGYMCPPYKEALKGWGLSTWKVSCNAAGRTRGSGLLGKGAAKRKVPRVEHLWRNPACMKALRAEEVKNG